MPIPRPNWVLTLVPVAGDAGVPTELPVHPRGGGAGRWAGVVFRRRPGRAAGEQKKAEDRKEGVAHGGSDRGTGNLFIARIMKRHRMGAGRSRASASG